MGRVRYLTMPKSLPFFLSALVLVAFAPDAVSEPKIIFLVRHAERADAGGPHQDDPKLSETGRARAAALAEELRDAGVKTIYTSEMKRTQQTAASLAQLLGITPSIVPARDVSGLAAKLKENSGNGLVIGHSNTLPEIIKALGVATPVTIGENDYDDLFLVVLAPTPRLIHLHYR